jgi:hypothetical protein
MNHRFDLFADGLQRGCPLHRRRNLSHSGGVDLDHPVRRQTLQCLLRRRRRRDEGRRPSQLDVEVDDAVRADRRGVRQAAAFDAGKVGRGQGVNAIMLFLRPNPKDFYRHQWQN